MVYASDGDDIIISTVGNDRLYGGEGSDLINPGSGSNLVDGGPDDDVLLGASGSGIIAGGKVMTRYLEEQPVPLCTVVVGQTILTVLCQHLVWELE